MAEYLDATPIVDFNAESIQSLIADKEWKTLSEYDAIGAIYHFVKDDVQFGYNAADNIAASQVLRDGYGQCNTKGTLLIALLRAVGIPTRFHGFTIYNTLQKGAIPAYLFWLAPEKIIHSWVEVFYQGEWLNLEGFIIDESYLAIVQSSVPESCNRFIGYGIATMCFQNPEVKWQGKSTYIQKEGIADDYGIYENPDEFYQEKGTNLSGFKNVAFKYVMRHLINLNVRLIRRHGLSAMQVSAAI